MSTPRTLKEIDAEIAQTKQEIENVQGSDTEVYARIVGYYRSVRNWNKGKRNEYDQRKMFEYENDGENNANASEIVASCVQPVFEQSETEKNVSVCNSEAVRY